AQSPLGRYCSPQRRRHARGHCGRRDLRRRDVDPGGLGMSRTLFDPARSDAIAKSHERLPWSPSRVAGALLLAAWAGMFWFLFLSGRVNLYLSTRTSWVVPVGAILLTIASIGWLLSAALSGPDRVG